MFQSTIKIVTIWLKHNDYYFRKIYDREANSVFSTKGKWSLIDNHKIEIDSSFLNFDEDFIKYPELSIDSMEYVQIPIDKMNGEIVFCFGYFDGENCYRKIY